MVYKFRVHGQPTIFYEDEIFVVAKTEEEAAEMAKDGYREILEERFGWVDIDTINADILNQKEE